MNIMNNALSNNAHSIFTAGSALVKADFCIVFANAHLAGLVGFSCDELMALRLVDIFHPDGAGTVQEQIGRVIRGGNGGLHVEPRFRHKAGASGWAALGGRRLPGLSARDRGAVLALREDIPASGAAEEQLRTRVAYLQGVLDNAPLAWQSLDEQGRILDVNARWLNTLGYAREEVLGKWFGDFLAPGSVDVFAENFPCFKAAGGLEGVEFELLCQDGRQLHVAFNGSIEFDEQGRMLRTHCLFADISERRRHEAALARSEERYRTLVEGTDDLVASVGEDGRLLFVNHQAEAFFGLPAADCVGLSAFDFIHPDDRERTREAFDGWVHSRQSRASHENRQVSRTGEIRHVLWTINIVRDAQGQVQEVVSFGQDITARKQAETALAESKARYESLVASLPAGVVLQGADGRILAWNRVAEDTFGVPASEVVGCIVRERSWLAFHPDGSAWPPAECPALATLRTGLPCRDELMKLQRPDGDELWISINTSPLFNAGEARPCAVAVSFLDVTAAREAEAFKKHVERIVRHDVKAPLCSVLLGVEACAERVEDPFQEELFTEMQHNLRSVIDLVEATERITRMELSAYHPEVKPFDLLQVLRRIEHTLQPWIRSMRSRLQCLVDGVLIRPDATLPHSGEENLIENMLVNLLKNALEASPQGAAVRVSVRDAGGWRQIAIRNEGAVPELVRERFFDKYVTCGKGAGTGLGTYSARMIARAHGGDIVLDCSEEEATTVTVTLPMECPGDGA